MTSSLLSYAQILIAAALIAVVLFQPSTAGMGGVAGGTESMNAFHTKRGFEKFLFIATIVLGALFTVLCILAVVIR